VKRSKAQPRGEAVINDFPPLETERLMLRPLAAEHLDFVFRHFSDPDVHRYLVDEEPVSTRAQAQEIVDFYAEPAGKSYNRWVLMLKSEQRPIGTCGYHQWNKSHRRAEIGYDLEKASWNQGLMREALQTVIDFGFEEMALNRIGAMVHPENEASLGLLARLGFQKEGLLRDYYYQGEKFYNHWLLSLLRKEWCAT
jgi:ribosomal-protein-alanine N-acetyltransferase